MSSARRTNELDQTQREPLIADTHDPSRLPKEESIRHKLRTYESLLALRAGYMPSTEQVSSWGRYALRNSGVLDSRNRRLSTQGRTFVRDLRAWVEAVMDAAETKNGDDKIQDFLYHTSHAHVSASARLPDLQAAAQRASSSSDAQQLYGRLRLLGSLLYSSPEFRKMISDVSIIARDIFADAASTVASYASQAAEQVRPSEEELEAVDKGAETLPSQKTAQRNEPNFPSGQKVKQQAFEQGRAYAENLRRTGYETSDDIQDYLKQKFPKQRRDAVVNRLKKVVSDIQDNADFQDAVEFMIHLVQDYCARLRDAALDEGKKTKGSVGYDENFEEALQKGKEIITAFANGRSPDSIKHALAQVIKDVQEDNDLGDFYNDVSSFFHHLLMEPKWATTDQADAEAHDLYDRSRRLLDKKSDKYKPDIEHLFDEVNKFVIALQNDRTNKRVVEASKKVFNDLIVVDKRGGYKVKRRVVRDMMDVMLPRFISEVKFVPMPRIEYQDRDYDLILENVVLESEHFLPHRIFFEANTRAEFTSDYNFSSHYSGSTRLRIDNLNLFIKDASFIVRKKTGLIPFSDRGFFDIYMDGPGVSVDIILDKANYDDYYEEDSDAESYFHVQSVKVKIHRFRYKYNAYHSWAASLLSPVVKPTIKKMVARLLEDKIKEGFENADRELHALMERVRVATIANEGGGSLESWVRAVLSRPESSRRGAPIVGVSGNGLMIRNGGGAKRRRDGEYAVTIGADEELFPGEHGPGAILSKFATAEERVESQRLGGWRNEIFDVKC